MALLLGACGGPAPLPTATPTLLGTSWTLTAMHGEPPPVDIDRPITLSFAENGKAEGSAPCNSIYGYLDLEHFKNTAAGELSWSELSITVELCITPPGYATPAVDPNTLDDVYYDALFQSKHYAITGDVLALSDADGNVTLTYARKAGD